MGEQSGRLDLIQRAVKRLGATGATRPGVPPVDEGVSLPSPSDEMEPLDRQRPAGFPSDIGIVQTAVIDEPHERAAGTTKAEVPHSIRIKFGELRRRGMITPDNLQSNISFEFRAIKRKLLASARDQRSNALINNLVMITSALPGEGKTFTAANLALALAAERDLQVLLIDADVIHPSVGSLFENPGELGLTDLLSGKCNSVADVLHTCADIPNLSVIFSGPRHEHMPELISSRRTADLFLDMSTRYSNRVVIFDTPPVLASSETANLAEHMHQVIMLVAAGQASHSQVRHALDHVSSCRNISLIFNKAPKWHKVEGDPYYYYYGSDRTART